MTTPFIKPSSPGYPDEELFRRYRNILLQLKKTIQTSKNIDELKMQMEHFINANRHVTWPHHTSAVYHKDEAEKAVGKVVTEYQRYIKGLENDDPDANYQDLLDALLIVESMLGRLKGR